MEELDRLVKQVQMLKESMDMALTRSEQLFKLQEERLAILPQLEERLSAAIEEIETTNQALLDSLNESDGAIDELKKATAAQLLIVQQMKSQQQGENSSQQQ